ncbi:MAG: riboflavin synthase [Endomicrobium sp.]|nr:riboflavin synthase [Endomicrobium sp.]
MFTGLIEDLGTVKRISSSQITIDTSLDGISAGDSVAVNGACLTAVSVNNGAFTADYSPQTDKITTLSSLKINEKVNLERALTLSSRLGGHIVTGHIDGAGKIKTIEKQERFYRVIVLLDDKCVRYCVDKGSVAVDGISLTISKIENSGIELFIIPETFNNTVLKFKKEGCAVNIETDILAKYAEKFSKKDSSEGISLEMLKGNGFI